MPQWGGPLSESLDGENLRARRLAAVREGLDDPDPRRRAAAVWDAQALGSEAEPLVEPLLSALKDEDENVRCAVVRAIADVDHEPSRIASALFDCALNDPSRRVRSRAVGALGKLGPETVSLLLDDVSVDERRARAITARILRDLARAQPAALEALARVLENQDPIMRETAAWALWELGADAAPAMGPLLRALGDGHEQVRFYASWALGRMGVSAVPKLVLELQSEDHLVRCAAAQALGGIGADASVAVGALRSLLDDEYPAVRESVRQALARIEGFPAAVRPESV